MWYDKVFPPVIIGIMVLAIKVFIDLLTLVR